MNKALLSLGLAVSAASTIHAGEIHIGRTSVLSKEVKKGTCHTTTLMGPSDASAAYQKRQKERFEEPDLSSWMRSSGSSC
jgi:hypothetical protein